ncbi:MAG TPA: type II secretion system F family protein, partial [Candidatus Dojkabacteria bacterium]|nr:type II secretion system F family protein [Candidatus Dojkabacteria bacterium]
MNKEVKTKADKPKVEHKEEMIKPAGKDLPRRSVSASAPMKKKNAFYLGGVNPLKLAFAMRHLGIMLKSGLSLEAAVSVLAEQLDDNRLKDIFAEILYDINNGVSVAESMRKHKNVFSNLVISLISSGEQGGTLEKNLFILADYLKKSHELQQKVKGAMIYPLIVLGMTSVEVLGVVYFLLPRLDTMFSAFGDLPEFTRIVLDAAKFIRDNTTAIAVGGAITLIFGSLFLRKTKIGKRIRDIFALNFPVFKNLNKNNILATFSQTFALLLENG